MCVATFLPDRQRLQVRRALRDHDEMLVAHSWAMLESLIRTRPVTAVLFDPLSSGRMNAAAAKLVQTYPSVPFIAYVPVDLGSLHAVAELAKAGLEDVVLVRVDDSLGQLRKKIDQLDDKQHVGDFITCLRPWFATMLLVFLTFVARQVDAQSEPPTPVIPTVKSSLDSLAGIVVDHNGNPVPGAVVIVARLDGMGADTTAADSVGVFRVVIRGPDSTFILMASAPGLGTSREVLRGNTRSRTIRLESSVGLLAKVVVTAEAPRPRLPPRLAPDVGGIGRAASGSALNLVPGASSDNPIGGAILFPNVVVERNGDGAIVGVAFMGLPSEQSALRFDGVVADGLRIPRDARVALRVTGTTYDAARGGFSGGQVDVTTIPGTNIQQRFSTLSRTTDLEPGYSGGRWSASGSASGPILLDRLTYAGSAELSQATKAIIALDPSNSERLAASGITPRDAQTLARLLPALGIPFGPNSSDTHITSITGLTRLDFVPDSNSALAVQLHGALDRSSESGGSPLVASSVFGRTRLTSGGLTMWSTKYGGAVLHESVFGLTSTANSLLPVNELPLIHLRLAGESASGVVREISVGSTLDQPNVALTRGAQLSQSARWLARAGKHAFHAGGSFQYQSQKRDVQNNSRGLLVFDSIPQLESGQSAYFRKLTFPYQPNGWTTNLSSYIDDVWLVRLGFSIQGGLRADLNTIRVKNADANIAVTDEALRGRGVTGTRALDLSPRLAFTFDHPGRRGSLLRSYTVRGGAGRFVSDFRTDRALGASSPFIGANQPTRLECTGENSPIVSWVAASGPITPERCLDGTIASQTVPNGQLMSPTWKPPSSWRGNLGVVAKLAGTWTITLDYVASRTYRNPSLVDLNLSRSPAFVLSSERDRPVFASADTTALFAPYAGVIPRRLIPTLGNITQLQSDLHARARQFIASAEYFSLGGRLVTVGYALTRASDEKRGSDGASAGNPRESEWAPSALSPTHVMTFRAFQPFGTRSSLGVVGRFQSGLRYTPLVLGDVNGDGRLTDRAFVFDPAMATDTALASSMRELLGSSSSSANCLRPMVNTIAGRNSCVGRWSASLDATLVLLLGRAGMWKRSSIRFDIFNIPSLLDQLAHGSNAHGWGTASHPDDILLTVRSFDSASRRFAYSVNPSFGSVKSLSNLAMPFAIRVSLTLPLAPEQAAQQLQIDNRRKLQPSVDKLVDRYVDEYPNPALDVLLVADSIALRPSQKDALGKIARSFDSTMRTIWLPVAKSIHDNPYAIAVATARIQATRTPSALEFQASAEAVRRLLEPAQLASLPSRARFALLSTALRAMGLNPL